MVIEHVYLCIKPAQSKAFEQAMQQAKTLVASMQGFQAMRLMRHLQWSDRYILMISWDSVEAHQLGFRTSAEYQTWKALLHHFYDPMPTVEYYETCIGLNCDAKI